MICNKCQIQYSGSHECGSGLIYYVCPDCYIFLNSRTIAFRAFLKKMRVTIKVKKEISHSLDFPGKSCASGISTKDQVVEIANGNERIIAEYKKFLDDFNLADVVDKTLCYVVDSTEIDK